MKNKYMTILLILFFIMCCHTIDKLTMQKAEKLINEERNNLIEALMEGFKNIKMQLRYS